MRIRAIALATAVACAVSSAPALAANASTYYSTKQHYEPQGSVYAEAPAGFHQIYTSTVNRHGSRGLSSFKYDDLAQQMLEYAKEHDQLTELGEKLIPQVEAMISVNKELAGGTGQEAGYGNLTVVGREELEGIGQRNAQRNSALMDRIENDDLKVKYISSGEDRANDSGWNFGNAWLSENPKLSDNLVDGMEDGHVTIEARTDLMYAHKDKNAPSYEKYSQWKDSETLDSKVKEAYAKPASQTAARNLLNKIFADDFITALEDGSISFVGREKDDKTVEGIVDAALQFYNLYIIAPALAHEEKTPAEGWIFDQYMDEASGPTFAYLLDVEDYYQKGPAIEGQTVAYDNYEPLLKEMIQGVKDRAEGGDIAAEYRFGHAETIIPLAALLKLPGSEKGIPADELYSWENSDWRGDKVAPMGANIQWDAFQTSTERRSCACCTTRRKSPSTTVVSPLLRGRRSTPSMSFPSVCHLAQRRITPRPVSRMIRIMTTRSRHRLVPCPPRPRCGVLSLRSLAHWQSLSVPLLLTQSRLRASSINMESTCPFKLRT
ncbi:histidine-type phosphatase [Corynebacterium minutissimum]|uniref:Multiple inositol polyphosphate phosphatase 1 n=1 Tax=Corynebacterium minutissimum TaxID=38301 RepID=A0A376D2K5_9CORY|nr:histidine-type phosphatase [Corynebacterium minutissimum]QRP61490.1 histidine-type phosphatase [Corynebacterium minutissimum]STC80003.1 Histidine phosphatase superfamily (branch 2) [Corynebacterium minutissimum]